jgi:chromosome segregation ATPase
LSDQKEIQQQEIQQDRELIAAQFDTLKQMVFDAQERIAQLTADLQAERQKNAANDETMANINTLNRRLQAQQLVFNDNFQDLQRINSSQQEQIIQLQAALDEKEKKFDEMVLHAEQVDKGMQYLRNKMEESKLEADQLSEELALAQESLEALTRERDELKLKLLQKISSSETSNRT